MQRFDFGTGTAAAGYTAVTPETEYTPERGYGFIGPAPVSAVDRGGSDALRRDFCTGEKPFEFAVKVPEGNYRVSVTLGDSAGVSNTTVQAESRRLMLEKVTTKSGAQVTRTFTVNVRNPELKSGGKVRLKGSEADKRDWDDRLTLQFSGARPCIAAVEITPVEDVVTVYLAGDSTVTNQENEPWCAWGQMLPRFFQSEVAIANHAQSGESLKSFAGEKRLEKILDTIRPGDYLFIQFAHNDQKAGTSHVEPFTTYTDELKRYIGEARAKKAIPVLVTSMYRRRFDEQGRMTNTLGDYPEAMRRLAREESLALIDLNTMSRTLFEALGVEESKKAFVHYPAGTFPGQGEALKDDTHFSDYGGYELARCVVEGIRTAVPALAHLLAGDAQRFDPARPDSPTAWAAPTGGESNLTRPEGS